MSGKTGFLIFIFVGSIFSFSLLRAGTEKGDLKEYARIVKSAQEAFEIQLGGTVDPENLEITIENVGGTPVENPRLTVNGRYNWYTLEDLAAEITEGCTSEKEKAMAIFVLWKSSHTGGALLRTAPVSIRCGISISTVIISAPRQPASSWRLAAQRHGFQGPGRLAQSENRILLACQNRGCQRQMEHLEQDFLFHKKINSSRTLSAARLSYFP